MNRVMDRLPRSESPPPLTLRQPASAAPEHHGPASSQTVRVAIAGATEAALRAG